MENDSFEKFVKQLLEILNDWTVFTNEREVEAETILVNSFLEFAKEKGFGTKVEARGMRAGLGALCGHAPDSYLVHGNDDLEKDPLNRALEIWLIPAEKKIQLTIQDERLEIGKKLEKLIREAGVKIHFSTARQHKRALAEFFNNDFWELSKDCRH
jgi:hypothetical protein